MLAGRSNGVECSADMSHVTVFCEIEVKVTATADQDGSGQILWMLQRQRPGTVRTSDSPWRDKRANDSGARRLTHMRWDRTDAPRGSAWLCVALCGWNLAPEMAPMTRSRCSN
jgi:hypothetical protein